MYEKLMFNLAIITYVHVYNVYPEKCYSTSEAMYLVGVFFLGIIEISILS